MGQGGFGGVSEFVGLGWFLWGLGCFWGVKVLLWGQGGFCEFGEFMGLGCAALLVMAASSNQNPLRNSRIRFIPYRRRAFPVLNISSVP